MGLYQLLSTTVIPYHQKHCLAWEIVVGVWKIRLFSAAYTIISLCNLKIFGQKTAFSVSLALSKAKKLLVFPDCIEQPVGQHSVVELGITSRSQGATGWSALARECDLPRHSVDGVVLDATLHTVVIGRSHSQGSGHPPSFLNIVATLLIILGEHHQSDNILNT